MSIWPSVDRAVIDVWTIRAGERTIRHYADVAVLDRAHGFPPYIENANNYLVDYHIVFAGNLVYLMIKRAGHVFGLDGWMDDRQVVHQTPMLRWLTS